MKSSTYWKFQKFHCIYIIRDLEQSDNTIECKVKWYLLGFCCDQGLTNYYTAVSAYGFYPQGGGGLPLLLAIKTACVVPISLLLPHVGVA